MMELCSSKGDLLRCINVIGKNSEVLKKSMFICKIILFLQMLLDLKTILSDLNIFLY